MEWHRAPQICLAHYGCSPSSNHVAGTPTTDYAGVSEAAGLPAPAECHVLCQYAYTGMESIPTCM